MAEVSKESITDDVSTGGGEVDSAVDKEDSVKGCQDESKEATDDTSFKENGDGTTADDSSAAVVSIEDDETPNTADDGKSESSDDVEDTVTITSGNQILISVDVDKLMSEGQSEESMSNVNNVVEQDDDGDKDEEEEEDDDDDDIVEVPTPSERNVEEDGEWSTKSRLQSFVRWCRSKGFVMSPKVDVTSEDTCHRYGMVATDDIEKGEVICSTPRAMVFNPDNSRIVAEIVNYEDWLDTIGQSLDESSGWATLLIALMVEYNDSKSFWAPYLRLVPKPEEYGHPLFWSIEEHKDELRGTTLLYDIQRDIYNIESEYKQFVLPFIYRYKDICGNVERYSLGLYKRLVAFVMAYSFTEDYGCEPNMIPLADILNHHSTKNNAKLVFGDECVEVIAIKKISKGEEILNTFGKLGNAELLQTYGYADKETNVYDTLPILVNTFLDVMEKEEKVSDSYFQAKISLLNKTEIAHSDDFFLFDRNGMRRGPDLIQMLKILFMPEDEFDDLLKKRAGNRPDSFYQKLLRKLKLSKRTDISSGVAVIDIIESDEEEEKEEETSSKRKLDVAEIEIEDGEPPAKQNCEDSQHVPVVRSTTSVQDNGESAGNAILIDDDDSDEEMEAGNEDAQPDNSQDASEANKTDDADNSENNETNATEAVEGAESEGQTEGVKEGNKNTDNTESKSSESVVESENPIQLTSANFEGDSTDAPAEKSTPEVSSGKTGLSEKPNGLKVDDIEIVSEDIRCKITYETLNKELDRPGWKEFITKVINFQTNSLKADDLQTTDEARNKMSDRQFFSCQIRQGQREIGKIFSSWLAGDNAIKLVEDDTAKDSLSFSKNISDSCTSTIIDDSNADILDTCADNTTVTGDTVSDKIELTGK